MSLTDVTVELRIENSEICALDLSKPMERLRLYVRQNDSDSGSTQQRKPKWKGRRTKEQTENGCEEEWGKWIMRSGYLLMPQWVIAPVLSQPGMNGSLRTPSSRPESWLNLILGTLFVAVFHIVLTGAEVCCERPKLKACWTDLYFIYYKVTW